MGKSQITGKELGPGLSQRADGRFVRSFRRADGKVGKVYGKTLKEARGKYKQELVRIEAEKGLSNGRISLDDYFQDWVDRRERYHNIRESTAYRYRACYKIISKEIGKRQLRSITPHEIENLQQKLMETGHKAKTTNQYLGVLSKMFDSAVRKRLVPFNPVKTVDRVRQAERIDDSETWQEEAWEKRSSRALSPEEMKQFCRIADGMYFGPVVKFLFATGVRQGEMRALLWKDVDYDEGVIKIRKTFSIDSSGGPKLNPPKTRNGIRNLPFNDEIIKILDDQKKLSAELFGEEPKPEDFIFRNLQGKPIPRSTLREWFCQVCGKMPDGFAGISPHAARHTFVTLKSLQGVSLFVIKDLIGHSHGTPDETGEKAGISDDVTANVYLERNQSAMKEGMRHGIVSYIKRYLVEDVTYGDNPTGKGAHFVSVKYSDGWKSAWLTLDSMDDSANWYLTDHDIIQDLVNGNDSDDFGAILDNNYLTSFGDITLYEKLSATEDELQKGAGKKRPESYLVKVLIKLSGIPTYEIEDQRKMNDLIGEIKGHYTDEILEEISL